MCWDCGCMIPDDNHGNPDNLTTEKIRSAAKAGGNATIHKLMDNVIRTYNEKVMGTAGDITPVNPDALFY